MNLTKTGSSFSKRISMNELDLKITKLSKQVVTLFIENGLTLSTAESCTGGGVAAAITSVSGSSAMFNGAVVAYSNAIKSKVLGVNRDTLEQFGAVSNEVVKEMADGVRELMSSDIGISTSGIAGPTGSTPDKPVGLVHFGLSDQSECSFVGENFEGDRISVQKNSVICALESLISYVCL